MRSGLAFVALMAMLCIVPSVVSACAGGYGGSCGEITQCRGHIIRGRCPGPANIICCVGNRPAQSGGSCGAIRGACALDTSCPNNFVRGKCPGAANIVCCGGAGSPGGPPSGGGGGGGGGGGSGDCGPYGSAPRSSIQGNSGVTYSVVKVRPEHLTNPSAYNLSPTSADNTMTVDTACGFYRLHEAAKRSGVRVTISSAFRTLSRQNYFWNCYVTKSCNNGNLAARPGTSNHGRGLALDLSYSNYNWLASNARTYGFIRTVSSEPWHWEKRY